MSDSFTFDSTTDDIKRLCVDCDSPESYRGGSCDHSGGRCNGGCGGGKRRSNTECCFASIVTPLSSLQTQFSKCYGSVEFCMRRKNRTVTFQWESFTGKLAASGIAYLSVAQSVGNLPPYTLNIPIYLEYKGVGRNTHIQINNTEPNIRFYLNTDGSSTGTVANDAVAVAGGAVTWIVFD